MSRGVTSMRSSADESRALTGSGPPLHLEVCACVTGLGKPETLVQTDGPIRLLDLESHGLRLLLGLSQQISHQRGADARSTVFWEQGNVDEADLVVPGDHDSAYGLAVQQDYLMLGVGELGPVVLSLRRELHLQKRLALCRIPAPGTHLGLSSTAVQSKQERSVARVGGAKGYGHGPHTWTTTSVFKATRDVRRVLLYVFRHVTFGRVAPLARTCDMGRA